nr:hypothetical protein 10 [bacterium]
MAENNIRNYTAESAVEKCRIVKFGATDGTVAHTTAITDKAFGISTDVAASEGERADVIYTGPAIVETGDGAIASGDPLTSDSQGRAIKADTSSGGQAVVIGYAMGSSAAAGTYIDMVIDISIINSDVTELLAVTGSIDDLETVATDLVGAVNEVNTAAILANASASVNALAIGTLTELTTEDQDNVVAAINELNAKIGSTSVSGVTASDSVNGILTELASRIAALESA